MIERYEIASQLSEDVLGALYIADDTMLQRRVLCRHIAKSEDEERGDEWKKECAQHTGKIGAMQHPNMLTIYDISVENDGAYVVTQLVEGESLAERLERGALSQVGVYRMVSDMLEVIHAAHESNIFHGALHTGSIQRVNRASGGHRYLLVDLGLNELVSLVRGEKVKVADPVLMAPELHEDGRAPDVRSDLFMLGQLCYTALVGGHPYSDKSAEECIEVYRDEGMPPLENYVEGVDPQFAEWVMKLIESDPEKRIGDSEDAMVALHRMQLEEPEPNVPGVTNAVIENVAPVLPDPQMITSSQPIALQPVTSTVGVVAHSPERSDLELTQAQAINMANQAALVENEHKEKKRIMYIVGGLAALLIIGLTIVFSRGGGGSEKEDAQDEKVSSDDVAVSNKHSINIAEPEMINTVEEEEDPVVVELDVEEVLDWHVGMGAPLASEYLSKVDGVYLQNTKIVDARNEAPLLANPIRFKAGGKNLFPKAAIDDRKGSKPGAGFEVALRIPAKKKESITVAFYMAHKFCDLRIQVIDPRSDAVQTKLIPFTESGVLRIPVRIENPTPGDFYVFKVVSASATSEGRFMIGLNGVVVEK